MKKYLAAYLLWLAGVLSAALVAFLFYRRVIDLGEHELELELDGRRRRPPDPGRQPDPEPELED